MQTLATRRPVALFYALTLAFSWGYWGTLLALGLRVGPGSGASHVPGLLGPMLAALAVTALARGSPSVRTLLRRMGTLGRHPVRNLALALSPLALGALLIAGLAATGRPLPPATAFAAYPGLPGDWPLGAVVAAAVIANGLGEETGWRGFTQDHAADRLGRFRGSLAVAALWAVWHLPLFWLNASMSALVGPTLVGWLVGLGAGAFVLAHVYALTGRSILCCAIWHASYNLVAATDAGEGLPAALLSAVVVGWGIAVARAWRRAERS